VGIALKSLYDGHLSYWWAMPTYQTFMYCDCAQRSVLHGDRSRL